MGGGEHHVVLVVDTGVLRLEPGQDLQVHGLEDHPQVGVDVDQATSAGRFLDHEGTRPLAHVDAGGLLFEGGVTHHADFGGFAGDVRLAQAEAVGQVVGLAGMESASRTQDSKSAVNAERDMATLFLFSAAGRAGDGGHRKRAGACFAWLPL